MNTRTMMAVLAAGSALAMAAPAAAQSASGTVGVTGTVAAKCTATTPITGTITLNELANANGTVNSSFGNQSGGLSRSFTIRCTSPNPKLRLSSDALNNSAAATVSGYTGRVHYTSTLTAKKAGGGADASTTYTTADTLPADSTVSLGDRLANASDNITVTISNGTTTTATDLLQSGSYGSTINISVEPS